MSPSWFDSFEAKVHKSIKQLERLRKENTRLKGQIRKLEQKAASPVADKQITRERDQLRKRVEKLATQLESLLK